MNIRYTVLCCMLGLFGCASIVVEPATKESKGVRFYRPDMYVVVTHEIKDECVINVKMDFRPLPNMAQEYVIRIEPGIGIATLNPTLTEGWNLTAFSSTLDSKVPETITALATAATAVAGLRTPPAAAPPDTKLMATLRQACETKAKAVTPRPGLYRLLYDNGQISGIQAIPGSLVP